MESLSPDDKVFKYLAHLYADNHLTMKEKLGAECMNEEDLFKDGVTNGAYWYNVRGG